MQSIMNIQGLSNHISLKEDTPFPILVKLASYITYILVIYVITLYFIQTP